MLVLVFIFSTEKTGLEYIAVSILLLRGLWHVVFVVVDDVDVELSITQGYNTKHASSIRRVSFTEKPGIQRPWNPSRGYWSVVAGREIYHRITRRIKQLIASVMAFIALFD